MRKPRLRSPPFDLRIFMSYFSQSEQLLETVFSGYKQKWSRIAEHWYMFLNLSVSVS